MFGSLELKQEVYVTTDTEKVGQARNQSNYHIGECEPQQPTSDDDQNFDDAHDYGCEFEINESGSA